MDHCRKEGTFQLCQPERITKRIILNIETGREQRERPRKLIASFMRDTTWKKAEKNNGNTKRSDKKFWRSWMKASKNWGEVSKKPKMYFWWNEADLKSNSKEFFPTGMNRVPYVNGWQDISDFKRLLKVKTSKKCWMNLCFLWFQCNLQRVITEPKMLYAFWTLLWLKLR